MPVGLDHDIVALERGDGPDRPAGGVRDLHSEGDRALRLRRGGCQRSGGGKSEGGKRSDNQTHGELTTFLTEVGGI